MRTFEGKGGKHLPGHLLRTQSSLRPLHRLHGGFDSSVLAAHELYGVLGGLLSQPGSKPPTFGLDLALHELYSSRKYMNKYIPYPTHSIVWNICILTPDQHGNHLN